MKLTNLKKRCEQDDPEGFNFLFGQKEATDEVNDMSSDSENDMDSGDGGNIVHNDLDYTKYEKEDQIQKYKFEFNAASAFLDQHPELDFQEDETAQNRPTAVAPGEGKIPTNILTEQDWDIKTFPGLHPDGKSGLHDERNIKLTMQQYFEQRIQNNDGRFAMTPDYVFSAFACCERDRLDKNVGICFKRGKKKENGQ